MDRFAPALLALAAALAACGQDAPPASSGSSSSAPALEGAGWIGEPVAATPTAKVRALAFFKPT